MTPTGFTLKRIMAERMELYRSVPPLPPPHPRKNIPIYVTPAHVDNSVPTEEKVEWEVHRIWGTDQEGPNGCASRISGSD